MKKKTAWLKVFRYDPDMGVPRYREYEVPMGEGLTVQKALFYIADHFEDAPAFRPYMCNRGQCACCVLTINGKTLRACTTQLKEQMTIEPLFQYPVLRDLVVDFGKRVHQSPDGFFKITEGTMVFRPSSQGLRDCSTRRPVRQVVKIGVSDPLSCAECSSKDCIEACFINHMEHLEDRFGRRLSPKEITLKFARGQVQFSGICLQCPDQPCVKSCPTGAFRVRKGLVMGINSKLCIGCGFCLDACPFEVIWMNIERGYAVMCDLCEGEPRCVDACAKRAIEFEIVRV